jgi:GntR family transcriptional repressor for pyruvate dehydrogenase complex
VSEAQIGLLIAAIREATALDGADGELLSDTTAAHIAGLIESGQLRPGDRLPPERELAERLNISRTVVRESFRALEAVGLVHAHVGRGRFVVERSGEARSSYFVTRWLESHVSEFRDLSHVRQLLEREAVRLIRPEDMPAVAEQCAEILDRSRQALAAGDRETLADLDAAFHAAPLQHCTNRPLRILALGLVQGMRPMTNAVLSAADQAPLSLTQHERIAAAFATNDAELAAVLVGDHQGAAARRFAETSAREPDPAETSTPETTTS